MASAATFGPPVLRVFVSYARKDGAHAAESLRDFLKEANLEVWLDIDHISGGASWSQEIETALNKCDVLIAMLTEASYVSEICRAEQLWALDEGKLVIPLLAENRALVPIHLKNKNYLRFPEQGADLLKELQAKPLGSPVERSLRYDTIPNLPQNHVIRRKALDDLRNLVFTEGTGTNIAVTALAGMGGIGKTVLTTALCRDLVVRRAFPDGIVWITVGREWDGNFVSRMREAARALGDDLDAYDSPLACENRYRTILREKAALVVLDDVWSLDHLKPLLVDSPRSRFLFTTRDAAIAKAVTDRKYFANLLSEAEARELLARWAGVPINELPPEAHQITCECGDLALAVAQIGAMLRGLSIAEWRDTLFALQSADISAIEERLPEGQQSFFKSLAVSVQHLPEALKERYLKLAVSLEDVPAPLVVLQTLWKADDSSTRRIARYFVDRSLAFWEDQSDLDRGIKLHDLQLDYVRASFEEREALTIIHGALRLSAHVITQRPEEFAQQIIGRLLTHFNVPALEKFANDLAESAPPTWLRPLWPSLHPPGAALIRTIQGHSASVACVAVTSDEVWAISASEDKTLKVWDLQTGRSLRTLTGHSDFVYGVATTQDGRFAISSSKDKTLKLGSIERRCLSDTSRSLVCR